MKRFIGILLLLLVCLSSARSAEAAEEPEQTGDVLLIYDIPDLVDLTENILTAFNKTVDKVSMNEYDKEILGEYKYVVLLTPAPIADINPKTKLLCIGEGFDLPGVTTDTHYGAGLEISANSFYQYLNYIDEFSVISEFQGDGFGKVSMSFDRVYPFGIKTGNKYYVPYIDEMNISTFALGEMLPDFFDSGYKGGIYVIIEDVFGFSDLDMLCKTADELYLANIPFIVKAMPLYTNTDLDAFSRYAQALRYVESRNGAIVMTPPIVNGEDEDANIAEMKDIAVTALTGEGVTVLPSVEGFYFVDMEYLKEVKSPSKRYENFSFDVGILENLPRSDLQLKQMIANLNGRWYTFGSYREKFGLKSKLFLEVPFDEEIEARVETTELPLFFSAGSDILTIAVSIMLLVIIFLIYLSWKNYKGKFTGKRG